MPIQRIELGDRVVCDWTCGEDYTNRDDVGGITFGWKAVCPRCAPKCEATAKEYDELHFIRARCPEGMPFRRWVVEVLRGGEPGVVNVYTEEDAWRRLLGGSR